MTDQQIKDMALELLIELEGSCLDVVLIPAPDQRHCMHMIRVAQTSNAVWYRKFCDTYRRRLRRKTFKPDTLICRARAIQALERMTKGNFEGTYADRLMPFIAEKLKEIECASAERKQSRRTSYAENVSSFV